MFIDVLYIFRPSAHPLFQILYFLKARGSRIYKYTNIQIQILSISANVRTVIQSSTTSHPKDCHIFSDEPASLALMIVTGSLTYRNLRWAISHIWQFSHRASLSVWSHGSVWSFYIICKISAFSSSSLDELSVLFIVLNNIIMQSTWGKSYLQIRFF